MNINKSNLMKNIRFSQSLLIQGNVIFFMKIDSDENLMVKDLLLTDSHVNRNKLLFITKDMKSNIDLLDFKELDIQVKENFLFINNIKIELLDTVVKYGK